MTVAHFGEEGAYAAEAAARLYPDAELLPCHSVSDVMRAVTRREADYGVLPIENSLAGVVPETYDALAHAPLAIVDEAVLPVPHVLVGLPQPVHDAVPLAGPDVARCARRGARVPDGGHPPAAARGLRHRQALHPALPAVAAAHRHRP